MTILDALPPVRHPLVERHPVTQRRSLFLSPNTMIQWSRSTTPRCAASCIA
jgi:alpha-ketoglutarate-dependent taurine dioxygenase